MQKYFSPIPTIPPTIPTHSMGGLAELDLLQRGLSLNIGIC